MVKRVLLIAFALVLTLALSACDKTKPQETPKATTGTESESKTEVEAVSYPVVLYFPNVQADGFVAKAAMTDGTAEDIVSLLVEKGVLPKGCAVVSFEVTSNVRCTVDMNAAYGQAVRTSGTTGEYVLVGSLVNTLLTYYDLKELVLTVEGEALETGHVIYDYPLQFYENQPDYRLSEESAEDLWQILTGYWVSTDDQYFGFDYQDGIPCITYGPFESEGMGFGTVIACVDPYGGAHSYPKSKRLTVYFPALSNGLTDREEFTISIEINLDYLESDGMISIYLEGEALSIPRTYTYGGATFEEAYQSTL
ncbi:MAG: GerMN domain-containing protein [Coriobacteriia bacterium]|nr:GerMN domain-containing protein [Coriobacteriia bacterium]